MYRLVSSQHEVEQRTARRSVLIAFAIVLALSGAGLLGALAIGYYLPATAAQSYWLISRSSGVVAYVLLTVGMLWGLLQSGALGRPRITPLLALGLHSQCNWLALGLAALHGAILLKDAYVHLSVAMLVVPFLSAYRPLLVGLGIIGFYLMLLLSLSFYVRAQIGQRTFRLLHYASFGAFVLVTVHGLLAGTDSGALFWLYGVSALAVLLLTLVRITRRRRAGMLRVGDRYYVATNALTP